MRTHNLGYPRIGSQRELKKACEDFWAGKTTAAQLLAEASDIRQNYSPRVPSVEEIENLLIKAVSVVAKQQLWINPDCGLKTRGWPETLLSLAAMVKAAENMREKFVN